MVIQRYPPPGNRCKRIILLVCFTRIQERSKVPIVPFGGRYEWIVIDFACQQIGLVVVPVHPSSTEDEIKYISSEVQPAMCICYNMTQRNKFDHSINGIDSTPILVVHLDASEQDHFLILFILKKSSILNLTG